MPWLLVAASAQPLLAQPPAWDRYLNVYLEGGTLPLSNVSGNWEVEYVDESGSAYFVYAQGTLKPRVQSLAFGLGVSGGRAKGMHYEGALQLAVANPLHLYVSAAVGYNLVAGNLLVRPKLGIGVGVVNARVQEIPNAPGGLVVNGALYVLDVIEVKLESAYLAAAPGLDLLLPLNNWLALRGSVSYRLPLTTFSERIKFSESDPNSDYSEIQRERLDAPNATVYRNGNPVTTLDFRTQGVAASLGVAFRLGGF